MLASKIRDFGNLLFLKVLNRWVAGAKADDAISYCQKLNSKNSCIFNYLGEHHTDAASVFRSVKEYKHVIDMIAKNKMKAAITIKPSQLGFNVLEKKDSEKFCQQQILEIVKYATSKKVYTWLDMEDSRFTDFTLKFYRKFASRYLLGICLQANLRRTEKDLLDLIRMSQKTKVRIRLVKGIYKEKEDVAFTSQHEIHVKFLSLITIAFEHSPKDFGIAIGTHHTQAVELALKLQEEYKKKFFEIEVLKGVLPEYYEKLRDEGVFVTEYVPYGKDAFAYSVRRAMKNPDYADSILLAPFFDAYKKLYGSRMKV
jgi:proline dehydrogenase